MLWCPGEPCVVQRKDQCRVAALLQRCGEQTEDRPEAEPWSIAAHTEGAEDTCSTTANTDAKNPIYCFINVSLMDALVKHKLHMLEPLTLKR